MTSRDSGIDTNVRRLSDASSSARLPRSAPALVLGGLALLCLLGCRGPTIPADTEQLASGVWHHAVHLIEGPWAIHVVEIDLQSAWPAGIRLQTARAPLQTGGVARTSELAGTALAAINGDFFFAPAPMRTSGLQIRGGEIIEEPRSRSAFAMTASGRPVAAVFGLRGGLVTKGGHVLRIARLNRAPRAADELTLYNHYSWSDSVHAPVGFFLQGLDSSGAVANDTVMARVVQVRRQGWPLKLGPGQWLVAGGADFAQAQAISPGDTVQLTCRLPPVTERLAEAIGGGPRIVRDGVTSIEHEREGLGAEFAADRHPRTAIGFTDDGRTLFLVTVDGRQPGHSVGMSLEELASLMVSKLALFTVSRRNADQAINLDGGGSTTMVVRQKVVNRPSDQTGERPVANALLVVAPGKV